MGRLREFLIWKAAFCGTGLFRAYPASSGQNFSTPLWIFLRAPQPPDSVLPRRKVGRSALKAAILALPLSTMASLPAAKVLHMNETRYPGRARPAGTGVQAKLVMYSALPSRA